MAGKVGTGVGSTDDTVVRRKGSGRTGMYAVIAVIAVAALVAGGGYAAGWFKTSSSSATSSGCTLPATTTLKGAGSTLVAPLMFVWSDSYTQATVDYSSVGSGAGISDITDKSVDFGASDAPLSPTQRGAISAPGVVTIPESAGGVVPIYNLPGLSATLHFTGPILAAIYLGSMTNWNNSQLQAANPGVVLPNATIYVVERSDGSGTTFIWTSYLSLENHTWNTTVGHATSVTWPTGYGSKGNAGVTATVKSTADAIGYVDINYALTSSVAYGAVENPKGTYVLASVANIASAIKDANISLPAGTGDWYNVSALNAPGVNDYPIASLTYVFIYKDLGTAYGSSETLTQAENTIDFISWIVTTGQSMSAEYYYIPLASAVVAADLITIDSVTFNGAVIPICVPTG